MKFKLPNHSWLLLVLASAACSGERNDVSAANEATENVSIEAEPFDPPAESQPPPGNQAELPPVVTASPAYRCDDGNALYVDILSDERAVLVRNARAETPVRLERETERGPYSGDGRTLSGVGERVTYASPERPRQSCRQAQ